MPNALDPAAPSFMVLETILFHKRGPRGPYLGTKALFVLPLNLLSEQRLHQHQMRLKNNHQGRMGPRHHREGAIRPTYSSSFYLGSLNPTVHFYKYYKNMRYLYQAYVICNTNSIIHTQLYYF